MIWALFLVPFIAGLLAFVIRNNRFRRGLLLAGAFSHTVLSVLAAGHAPWRVDGPWIALDGVGALFLCITSVLFLISSVYAAGYLSRCHDKETKDEEEGFVFMNAPEAVFTGCMLVFLSTMTLVIMSQHFGVLWVAMEATTLVSAPLIYFHKHHRSLEAMWKYLLICSVGIAIALLGNLFLAIAGASADGEFLTMTIAGLVKGASSLNPAWLKAAFIFLLVGYGTKMGLAPLHTWLPDAHSEAPSVVSALLSGALLNCAFLGILRAYQVMIASGLGPFAGELLLVLGFISMFFAAVFIIGQLDYKRMLAYSSVGNMGIMAVGIGLGGPAAFAVMLHAVNHSFTKAMLFFTAGNILAVYKTKAAADVRGVMSRIPVSGILWVAGFMAIGGVPPFGMFLSKFLIFKAAMDKGMMFVSALYLILVAGAFIGMAAIFLAMSQGRPGAESRAGEKEPLSAVLPAGVLCLIVLSMGIWQPVFLRNILENAARAFTGS